MIDAHLWQARYTDSITLPLVCWMEDDGAIVGYVLTEKGALRPANSYNNFVGYERADPEFTGLIPAEPGWWLVEQDSDDRTIGYWSRVVAWQLSDFGWRVNPIALPPDGLGDPPFPDDTASRNPRRIVFAPAHRLVTLGPWPDQDVSEVKE